MYKICHISTVHNKFDDRIFYKECVSLANAGFDVSFIVQSEKNEIIDKVNIIALPYCKNRRKRILALPFIAFYKTIKTKAKIVHFHDPELILIAIFLKLLGKKVIYDVHELVYHQIRDKEWLSNKTIKKIISFSYKFTEKLSIILFNKIILAENGYLNYFQNNYSKYLGKIIFIRNFPVLGLINKTSRSNREKSTTVLLYAGGLTKIRGIKEVIDSLVEIDFPVELWLLGKFDSNDYEQECMKSAGWEKVKNLGFIKHEEVYSYIFLCDIGISMLYPLQNYLTSLPVKAFEYMACEKPIIMSDFDYWKEVFGNVALFCNPLNPKEIASCINTLIIDKNKADYMAKKGRELILEKYSWEAESIRLTEIYNSI